MKRVLLTGASGTVGKEVLKQLYESSDSVGITVFDKRTSHSNSFYRKFRNKINLVYGDILNEIIDFRKETIDDYFIAMKTNVSPLRKALTMILRKIITYKLQKKSEPLAAADTNNSTDIHHYF